MGVALLAMDGLRRGGKGGIAETAAGRALIGYRFGGPLARPSVASLHDLHSRFRMAVPLLGLFTFGTGLWNCDLLLGHAHFPSKYILARWVRKCPADGL